jgi:hypothetical protein
MWWTARQAVVEGLCCAGRVLATEAQAAWPDYEAARRAHDEVAWYLPILEQLDARVPGGNVLAGVS